MPVAPICHTVLCVQYFCVDFSPSFSLFVSLFLVFFSPCLTLCPLFYCSLSFSLSAFAHLFHSKLIPTCPRTTTKPACLFMLHWGITLFLCYYFFVKSPRYDLPQTALCCPTLIIFSHSATLGHKDTHTHFLHKPTAVCVYALCQQRFNGNPPVYFCINKRC